MNTTHNRLTLNFNRSTLGYTICHKSTFWKTKSDFNPFIKIGEDAIAFKSAETIIHHPVHTGTGSGFLSRYEGFKLNGEDIKNADAPYIVNPYALLWNNGHQYLIATTNGHENISHYRIDRIYSAKIHKIADEKGNFIPVKRKAVPPSLHSFYNRDDFNAEKYATTFPLMISASDNKRFLNNVVLECPTTALSTIIDHFGHDIKISTSDRTFTSNTPSNNQLISFCKIELKRVCYESILTFCLQQQASVFSPFPRIVALAPKVLIDDIKLKLRETLEYYESL